MTKLPLSMQEREPQVEEWKPSTASGSDKETIVGWGLPDYDAGVNQVMDVAYTAPENGIVIYGHVSTSVNGASYTYATINGLKIITGRGNNYSQHVAHFFVKKGDVYTVTRDYETSPTGLTYYPCRN